MEIKAHAKEGARNISNWCWMANQDQIIVSMKLNPDMTEVLWTVNNVYTSIQNLFWIALPFSDISSK